MESKVGTRIVATSWSRLFGGRDQLVTTRASRDQLIATILVATMLRLSILLCKGKNTCVAHVAQRVKKYICQNTKDKLAVWTNKPGSFVSTIFSSSRVVLSFSFVARVCNFDATHLHNFVAKTFVKKRGVSRDYACVSSRQQSISFNYALRIYFCFYFSHIPNVL